MDIRKYFQDCLLAILLLSIHHGFSLSDDDYEDGPVFGRCPRIRNKLKNGRVRYRYKGRVAKFLCDSGYELAGKRSSTCSRGQWSNPIPVCVARGCNRVPSIANGRVIEMYRGALLVYDCNPGYTLTGDISIHCDGRSWNASPPICGVNPEVHPETSCDFESPYLCGWTQDPTHDFDWKRNLFSTPSGHVGTGPSYDHTFGENKAGFYLYIEASSPRKINDTARLFSPVYPAQESGGCFIFWYHMYGATTGGLRVYFKPESHMFGELSPKWEKFGDQGNQWLRGNMSVPSVNENFQIIIEGIRGESYVGDSAIDDVQLTEFDCQAMENITDTTTKGIVANSCRGRCQTPNTEDSCECQESCIAARSCCSDYVILCSGEVNSQQQTNEPEPGDYYGKTTSPLTVAATLTSATTTEAQAMNVSSNLSFESTSEASISSRGSSLSVTTSVVTVSPGVLDTSPSTSSEFTTTAATIMTSSAATVRIEPTASTDKLIISSKSTSTISPSTTTLKLRTTDSEKTSNAIDKTVTTAQSSKPTSNTKTTDMASTKSTVKRTTSAPKTSESTNVVPAQSTTISTTTTPTSITTTPVHTTERSMTTAMPTTQRSTITTAIPTTRRSTTTTAIPTTRRSTTTTAIPTTRRSTTTTPMSTTQRSTTTTPMSTAITSSTTSTTSTTMSTTTLKSILVPRISTNPTLSPVTASSVPPISTIPDTTTKRYNLRPRSTTSTSTPSRAYSTETSYYSSTQRSLFPLITTVSTPTLLSTIRTTPQTRRWFNFTARLTSTSSSTKTSTTTPTLRTRVQYPTEMNKYSYRMPKYTTTEYPATSDSYEMANSKTESPKSNGNSSVTIILVVFAILGLLGGVVFYIRRYRRKSNMDDDSEMRFLPESDYMEYSDASALDRILVK